MIRRKAEERWRPLAQSFANSFNIQSGATLELNAFSPAFCRQLARGQSDLDCIGLCASLKTYTALSQAKGTALNVTYRTDSPSHICYPASTFALVYSILPNRLQDLPLVLEEAYRVLTPNGRLVLYLLDDWSALSKAWLGVSRLMAPRLYWRLRTDVLEKSKQQEFLEQLKQSSFKGGQIQEHGPFLRIELPK